MLLVDVETGELVPLTLRFVADPQGDPQWGANTLALAPALGHPPRSGATLAAVVMRSVAGSPDGWEPADEVLDALDLAGVRGKPAIATVFTVQDATAELRALYAHADANVPDWGTATFKRVVRLEFTHGETPGGEEATGSS